MSTPSGWGPRQYRGIAQASMNARSTARGARKSEPEIARSNAPRAASAAGAQRSTRRVRSTRDTDATLTARPGDHLHPRSEPDVRRIHLEGEGGSPSGPMARSTRGRSVGDVLRHLDQGAPP